MKHRLPGGPWLSHLATAASVRSLAPATLHSWLALEEVAALAEVGHMPAVAAVEGLEEADPEEIRGALGLLAIRARALAEVGIEEVWSLPVERILADRLAQLESVAG